MMIVKSVIDGRIWYDVTSTISDKSSSIIEIQNNLFPISDDVVLSSSQPHNFYSVFSEVTALFFVE
jgi:hypothetical protein